MGGGLAGGAFMVGVAVVLILAVLSRLAERGADGTSPPQSNPVPEASAPGAEPLQAPDPPAAAEAEGVGDADAEAEIAIDTPEGDLVSAEGYVFLPEALHVLVLPPLSIEQLAAYEATTEEEWEARVTYAWERAYAPGQKYLWRLREPHQLLAAGDLSAARIVPSPIAAGTWVLETIGREGDFSEYSFASEPAARAVLDLLADREIFTIVEDADGHPVPPSPGQFADARQRLFETEAALDLPVDQEAHGS